MLVISKLSSSAQFVKSGRWIHKSGSVFLSRFCGNDLARTCLPQARGLSPTGNTR
jgi:hypothetical protein